MPNKTTVRYPRLHTEPHWNFAYNSASSAAVIILRRARSNGSAFAGAAAAARFHQSYCPTTINNIIQIECYYVTGAFGHSICFLFISHFSILRSLCAGTANRRRKLITFSVPDFFIVWQTVWFVRVCRFACLLTDRRYSHSYDRPG